MLPALLLVLPPLLWLLWTAGTTVSRAPLLDVVARGMLTRSLRVASLATLMALGLGVPYGWAVARYRLPGRRLLALAALLPLLLPPYAGCLAWEILLIRSGPLNTTLLRWGWLHAPFTGYRSQELVAWILASTYWPIIAWATLFTARAVPQAQEDAARLHLPDESAARWAAWPALRRSLPAAALLPFLLSLADFGVSNTLGLSTYPVEIVNRFQLDRNIGATVQVAAPLLLLLLVLVALQIRWLDRAPLFDGGPAEPRDRPLFRGRSVLLGGTLFCTLVLLATTALPLAVLAAGSLPLRTYVAVWNESSDHFVNTLVTAGGGALLAAVLALAYGWAARSRRLPVLDLLLTLPYALPGSLIGMAMIRILAWKAFPSWLYDGDDRVTHAWAIWTLVWTYAALFFPFAHKTLQPAWGHVDPHLLDEGRVLGAGGWTLFSTAAWPVIRPFVLAGGVLVAILGTREIDATALLRPPDCDTIAFRIQDYLHFAPGPNVAALCIVVVLLGALVVGGFSAWLSRPEV